ncbi:MAG: 16S rRNA (cytosine(967)-C(5))-methyltransferase RsmB [Bacteroidota bacterium]
MNEENFTPINEQDDKFSGVRSVAIRILSRFERSDAYLDKLLERELKEDYLSQLDKSLLTELVNGVVRWRWKLDWVLTGFYHGDYLKCLNIVKNALRVALYQIMFLNKIPTYAAINESVEFVKNIQGEKTANIVNAVLRTITRNLSEVRYPDKTEDPAYYLAIMYSHPRWMVKKWVEHFGETETESLLSANNRKPFIPVRVNGLKATPDAVIDELNKAELPFFQSLLLKQSIVLKTPRLNVASLDIYKNGWITVQDTSASLAALLAAPKEGDSIIDLCSAPGGKSFFLAELMKNNGKIVAVDKYKSKLEFIEKQAERLGLTCISTLAADASTLESEERYDIVFVDVPCSGTGTISKKPDIKWKREREDFDRLLPTQKAILENASKFVKPNGTLLYSTCSVEPEENYEAVNKFLEHHPEFEVDKAENYLPVNVCRNGFMQTFPHIHFMDGAFAARLIKKG